MSRSKTTPGATKPTMKLLTIAISKIYVSNLRTARDYPAQKQEALNESVAQLGLLHPLLVRRRGSRYELLAGGARVEAAVAAGASRVRCQVLDDTTNDLVAEQAALEENLRRHGYSGAERMVAVSRLARIHKALYGKTRRGGDRRSQKAREASTKGAPRTFDQAAAKTIGCDRSTITRGRARAERLAPEALKALKEGRLTDTKADLLVALPVAVQAELLPAIVKASREEARDLVTERRLGASGAPSVEMGLKVLTSRATRADRAAHRLVEALGATERIVEIVKDAGASRAACGHLPETLDRLSQVAQRLLEALSPPGGVDVRSDGCLAAQGGVGVETEAASANPSEERPTTETKPSTTEPAGVEDPTGAVVAASQSGTLSSARELPPVDVSENRGVPRSWIPPRKSILALRKDAAGRRRAEANHKEGRDPCLTHAYAAVPPYALANADVVTEKLRKWLPEAMERVPALLSARAKANLHELRMQRVASTAEGTPGADSDEERSKTPRLPTRGEQEAVLSTCRWQRFAIALRGTVRPPDGMLAVELQQDLERLFRAVTLLFRTRHRDPCIGPTTCVVRPRVATGHRLILRGLYFGPKMYRDDLREAAENEDPGVSFRCPTGGASIDDTEHPLDDTPEKMITWLFDAGKQEGRFVAAFIEEAAHKTSRYGCFELLEEMVRQEIDGEQPKRKRGQRSSSSTTPATTTQAPEAPKEHSKVQRGGDPTRRQPTLLDRLRNKVPPCPTDDGPTILRRIKKRQDAVRSLRSRWLTLRVKDPEVNLACIEHDLHVTADALRPFDELACGVPEPALMRAFDAWLQKHGA